jgi:hypothetical protein
MSKDRSGIQHVATYKNVIDYDQLRSLVRTMLGPIDLGPSELIAVQEREETIITLIIEAARLDKLSTSNRTKNWLEVERIINKH